MAIQLRKFMKRREDLLSLGDYIFYVFLAIMLFASGVSILTNVLTGFPMAANVKWGFAMLLCIIGFVLLQRQVFVEPFKMIVFCAALAFIALPSWFYGGGDNTITLLYMLMLTIEAFLMFERKALQFTFTGIVVIAAYTLLTIHYRFPELIQNSTAQDVYADSLVQLAIVLVIIIISIAIYTQQHRNQNAQLAQANAQLIQQVITDELTQVYNKRKVTTLLSTVCANSQMQSVYVGMIDVDFFKSINDTRGHLAGDKSLHAVATHLTETVGDKGCVGRYGGDEFLLILYNMTDAAVKDLAQKLLQIPIIDGDLQVTLSGGIAKRGQGQDANALISNADARLLQAKQNGKNRIEFSAGVGDAAIGATVGV